MVSNLDVRFQAGDKHRALFGREAALVKGHSAVGAIGTLKPIAAAEPEQAGAG